MCTIEWLESFLLHRNRHFPGKFRCCACALSMYSLVRSGDFLLCALVCNPHAIFSTHRQATATESMMGKSLHWSDFFFFIQNISMLTIFLDFPLLSGKSQFCVVNWIIDWMKVMLHYCTRGNMHILYTHLRLLLRWYYVSSIHTLEP